MSEVKSHFGKLAKVCSTLQNVFSIYLGLNMKINVHKYDYVLTYLDSLINMIMTSEDNINIVDILR